MKQSKEELLQTRDRIDIALYSHKITEGIKLRGTTDTKSVRDAMCHMIKMQFDYEEKWGDSEEVDKNFEGINKVLDILNKIDNDTDSL